MTKSNSTLPRYDDLGKITTDQYGFEWVAHRPGCGCRGVAAQEPAMMRDKRGLTANSLPAGVDGMMAWRLLSSFLDQAAAAGRPVGRISESQFNAAGELIGPKLEIRSCEAARFHLLLQRVSRLIEKAAAEI